MVEAKARHDAAQKGFRFAHRVAIGLEPADKRVLTTSSASATDPSIR
jgi:hypothetical protein